LVFGKDVIVHTQKTDRYGRWLATVSLPNGVILNQALVQAGYAWWYRQYSHDGRYAALEAEAKAAHRGLWQDAHPLAPWTFRRQESATHSRDKRSPS
jgi:endonuclease YncB( thermonuclease family)